MNRNKPERCITSAGGTIFIIPLPWQYNTCTIYLLILKLFSDFKLCLYKFIYNNRYSLHSSFVPYFFCPSPSSPPLSLYNIVFFRIFSLSLLYHELLLLFFAFYQNKKNMHRKFSVNITSNQWIWFSYNLLVCGFFLSLSLHYIFL